MQIPVRWRNATLLPIWPAGILFDSSPQLCRRERSPRRKALHGAGDIHSDQNVADVKDDGAEFCRWHAYLTFWLNTAGPEGGLALPLERSTPMTAGRIE